MKSNYSTIKSVFDLRTERLILSVPTPVSAGAVTDYLLKNRSFHQPYQMIHGDEYYTKREQKQYLKSDMDAFFKGTQFGFWLRERSDPSTIIGRLSFTGIVRGALQSCLMGYHIDQDKQGEGLMTEAIFEGCRYMFEIRGIHRIQADIMPDNLRSLHTIKRCGFVCQGLNREYMAIDGQWRDHMIFSRINADYRNPEILR